MNDADQHLLTLFSAALDCASDTERAAYLDQACGPDPALRARVEALLRAHEGAGRFLVAGPVESPLTDGAMPPTTTTAAELEAGTVVAGRYKLLEVIGEGGMGTVWLAEQQKPVRRKVALKVIKPGMNSRLVLARFEAERQALALMDHPNIARVLDGGATADGRPFFAMELVKGVPLTRYCDEKRLNPKERLELFVPVCQAIQHAHQKGVIHRDLKPSNVLVAPYDGRPVPKVIDFGVAKAAGQSLTEKTLFTGLGAVVGTPEYMSPEQAELNNQDIDTRSDVYSLGALLYELLTGTTPLTHRRVKDVALLEVLRAIREEEPPRPSTRLSSTENLPAISAQRQMEPVKLTKLVRGELDWIVMKCLEKDRNRRYDTANSLALDLQRYLADEAVQACPPSAWYRFRKFARRNKRGLIAAMGVAAALLVGFAVSVVLLVIHAVEMQKEHKQTIGEYNRAETALKQAKGNLERAEQNLTLALEAMDDVYMKNVEDRILKDRRMTEAERESLRKGLEFYERFAQHNSGHAELQRPIAKGYRRAGFLRMKLNDLAEAQAYYAKAIAVFEKWADESHDSVEDQLELARACYGMAVVLRKQEQCGAAALICRRAIAVWKKLAADRQVPSHRAELASCLWELAVILSAAQQHVQAEEAIREAMRLYEALVAEYPKEPEYRLTVGFCHRALGEYLQRAGRKREATESYKKAVLVLGSLVRSVPGNTFRHHEHRQELGWAYCLLGSSLCESRQPQEEGQAVSQEAAAAYCQGLTILETLVAEFPAHPDCQERLAKNYGNLLRVLKSARRVREAQEVLRRALKFYERMAAAHPNEPGLRDGLARSHHNRAKLSREIGQPKEVAKAFREAIALGEKLAADFPTQPEYRQHVADTYGDLAYLLMRQQEEKSVREALRLFEGLIAEYPKASFSRRTQYAAGAGHAARYLSFLLPVDRMQEKLALLQKAADVFEKLVTAHPDVTEFLHFEADTHRYIGDVLSTLKRYEEAEKAYRKAVDLFQKLSRGQFRPGGYRNFTEEVWGYTALTNFLMGRNRPEDAATVLRQATALYEKFPNDPNNRLVRGHLQNNLAGLLQTIGQPEEAAKAFRQAIAIWEKLAAEYPKDPSYRLSLASCHWQLGDVLRTAGRHEEAAKMYRRSLELQPDNDHEGSNKAAWFLATCADPKFRDPGRAVELAKKATELVPKEGTYWTTLGVANYRAGNWKAALEVLDKSMQLRKGGDSFDWFFLAMAHWQRGEKDKSRQRYDQAVQWMEKNQPKNDELRRFQAEAAELLKDKEKKN
ncbi:MAG TPA: tetratricopeptide repeat protein [Gemmataceae bacterium]